MKNKREDALGKKYLSRTNGEVTVIEYNHTNDVTVVTESGAIISGLRMGNIKQGYVGSNITNRKGEKFINIEGYEVEIIEYFSATNCTARFDDGTILYNRQYTSIKYGTITNPNYKFLYKRGYLGQGVYKVGSEGKVLKHYKIWYNMFLRCYDEKVQEKQPSYKRCFVDEQWHNFQNFAEWFDKNYNPEIMEGWHLDKDILVKGNKIYSPETCCFVPQEINTLIISCKAKRGELPIGVSKKGKRFLA